MIRVKEVAVILDDGEALGTIPIEEAIAMAEDRNLDLVEVAPNSNPPVCRIMDYGKHKYKASKKAHEAKKNQKIVHVKEVKFRPNTDQHDFDFKLKHVQRFLENGDKAKVVFNALGALRLKLADRESLIDESSWAPLWVVDFPLVEWNEDADRWDALHHPFTSPNMDDIDILETSPGEVRSLGYDIVMNGYELGGGSIRIHDKKMQQTIFKILGISDEEAEEKF